MAENPRRDDVAKSYGKIQQSRKAAAIEAQTRTPADVHRGQARIAYRMADRYRNKLLHVTGIGWHRWDGARWVYDDRGTRHDGVRAHVPQARRW